METTTEEKIEIIKRIQDEINDTTSNAESRGLVFIESDRSVTLTFECCRFYDRVMFMGLVIWDDNYNDIPADNMHANGTTPVLFEDYIRERLIDLIADLSRISRCLIVTADARQDELELGDNK